MKLHYYLLRHIIHFQNITKGKNNIFKYSNDNGISWKVLELDTGSHQVKTLSNEMQD